MTKIKLFGNSVVITPMGFVHVFNLSVGDYVLNAENYYVKVSKVEKGNFAESIEIKGHGCPNLKVFPEHEVFASQYETKWNKEIKANERVFSPLLPVSSLQMKGFFWASPINLPLHPTSIEKSKALAWMLGAYFSCGFTMFDGKMNIKTNDFRFELLEKALQKLNFQYRKKYLNGVVEYFIDEKNVGKWAKEHISVGYKVNSVPMEVYGWEENLREKFFLGVIWGKGMDEGDRYKITLSNKTEAMAIKVLAQSIGLSVALYVSESGKAPNRIEKWQLVAEKSARSSDTLQNHRIGLVRSVGKGKPERFYNVELEQDVSGLYVDSIMITTKKEG